MIELLLLIIAIGLCGIAPVLGAIVGIVLIIFCIGAFEAVSEQNKRHMEVMKRTQVTAQMIADAQAKAFQYAKDRKATDHTS